MRAPAKPHPPFSVHAAAHTLAFRMPTLSYQKIHTQDERHNRMILSLLHNNQIGGSLLFSFLTFKRWCPSNAPWLVKHTGVLCVRAATPPSVLPSFIIKR